MRRFLALFLFVLLLCMAGCTDAKKQETDTDGVTEQSESLTSESEQTQPTATEDPEPTDTEPVSASEPVQETVLERGVVEGNSYCNAALGIGCTLPEGWSFYDDTQIGQGSGDKTTPFDELFLASDTAYDMLAVKAFDGLNVSVSVQNLGESVQTISGEAFADLSVESTRSAMAAYGMTVTECDKEQITFLGESQWSIFVVAEVAGRSTAQRFVFFKYGDCFVMVTAGASDLQTADALLQSLFWRD